MPADNRSKTLEIGGGFHRVDVVVMRAQNLKIGFEGVFLDFVTQLFEQRRGCAHCVRDLRRKGFAPGGGLREADAQGGLPVGENGKPVSSSDRRRIRIASHPSSHRVEESSAVADRTGQAERVHADKPEIGLLRTRSSGPPERLGANQAAEGGGNANRAPAARALGEWNDSGRYGSRGSP